MKIYEDFRQKTVAHIFLYKIDARMFIDKKDFDEIANTFFVLFLYTIHTIIVINKEKEKSYGEYRKK